MKKTLALLLALVMVFALAACGGSDDTAEPETETTETEAVEAEPAAEAEAEAEPAAEEGDDIDGYKEYVNAYAAAGAPDEEEAAAVAEAVNACATIEEIEAVSQLTVLYENVGMLTYADWVAAGKPAAETEGMVSEADQQASGESSSGEASGEGGGATLVEPDASYSKDFDGYLQYVKDAFASDTMAPDDMKETTNAGLEDAVDENDETIAMLVEMGLVVSYEDFLAA
ncbi:MAG: hypothetical protein LUE22_10075 [Oscillospiraceae bacterium]|nr:hypothetical protein [Oscillospiraceae bacterium]